MKYVSILVLFALSCVSGQTVTTVTKKERVRNAAIWGSEEDLKLFSAQDNAARLNFINTLETFTAESALFGGETLNYSFTLITSLRQEVVVQGSAFKEAKYNIFWEDDSRELFLRCSEKFAQWTKLSKQNKDFFSKNLCSISVRLETYPNKSDSDSCKANGTIELNFNSYSVAPFSEVEFNIPETLVSGENCINAKIESERYRVGAVEFEKMVKLMSDDSIKKFAASEIAKKKRINATYK